MGKFDISIGVVERETGLSKEVLRKWEARYDFPRPRRDGNGVRFYSGEQLQYLRAVKRLIDCGIRPSQALCLSAGEMEQLSASIRGSVTEPEGELFGAVLDVLLTGDTDALERLLSGHQLRMGVQAWILQIIAPLTLFVGDAWADGRIGIRHEHMFAEVVQRLLHRCTAGIVVAQGAPCALLATPSGESHTLGVLMLNALLRVNGWNSTSLGAQVPASELAEAAKAGKVQIVGVSFSVAFPVRSIGPYLAQLRKRLPPATLVWVGGAGAARPKTLPAGTVRFSSLEAVLERVATNGT